MVFRFFGLLLKISQNNTRNAGRPRAEEKRNPRKNKPVSRGPLLPSEGIQRERIPAPEAENFWRIRLTAVHSVLAEQAVLGSLEHAAVAVRAPGLVVVALGPVTDEIGFAGQRAVEADEVADSVVNEVLGAFEGTHAAGENDRDGELLPELAAGLAVVAFLFRAGRAVALESLER